MDDSVAQRGFSLVSLMVGLLISTIAIAGMLSIYRTSIDISARATPAARQDGERIAALIRAELQMQKAGFGVDNPSVGTNLVRFDDLVWTEDGQNSVLEININHLEGAPGAFGNNCNNNNEGNNGNNCDEDGYAGNSGNANGNGIGNGNGNGNSNEGSESQARDYGDSIIWSSDVNFDGNMVCEGIVPSNMGGLKYISATCTNASEWASVTSWSATDHAGLKGGLNTEISLDVEIDVAANCSPFADADDPDPNEGVSVKFSVILSTGNRVNEVACLYNF